MAQCRETSESFQVRMSSFTASPRASHWICSRGIRRMRSERLQQWGKL